MNRNGQVVFYTFMLAVVVIIIALAFAPVLKSFTDTAREPTTDTAIGLDCNNSSISNFDKGVCIMTDMSLPYFILALIGLAGIIIGAKVVFGGSSE